MHGFISPFIGTKIRKLVEAAAEQLVIHGARRCQVQAPGWPVSTKGSASWNSPSRSFSPGRGPVSTISTSLSGRKPARRIIWWAKSMILTGSPRRRCEDNKRLEIQQPWKMIIGGASSSRTSTGLAKEEQ